MSTDASLSINDIENPQDQQPPNGPALPAANDIDLDLKEDKNDDQSTKDNKQYIRKIQTEWQRYYAELGAEKKELLKLLAPKERHAVPFIDGTTKEYDRKRIGTRQYLQWERERAKLRKEKDPEKSTDILLGLYEKIAYHGLGLEKEDYENTIWEDALNQPGIKTICDAINHRATVGGAFFQRKP